MLQFFGGPLEQLPGLTDVGGFGVGLPDAQPQGVPAIQDCVRQIELSALVDSVQQPPVEVIPGAVSKANQIERCGRGQLEIR